MTQLQTEIYQELQQQGMNEVESRFISTNFKNRVQEKAMMNYLMEIREKTVSTTQVIITSLKIKEM